MSSKENTARCNGRRAFNLLFLPLPQDLINEVVLYAFYNLLQYTYHSPPKWIDVDYLKQRFAKNIKDLLKSLKKNGPSNKQILIFKKNINCIFEENNIEKLLNLYISGDIENTLKIRSSFNTFGGFSIFSFNGQELDTKIEYDTCETSLN
jgi:hypothetical protein